MNKKYLIALIVILAAMVLAGCFVENDPSGDDQVQTAEAWGVPPFTGEKQGISNAGYGGNVTVTLTLVDGKITAIDVKHFETDSIGKAFIDRVKPLIVKANSFDPVDTVSGPTAPITKGALKEAGKKALNSIPGVTIP